MEENADAIMEGALIARDRVGVQDFVLLDSHTSETAFLSNLRKRYQENLIYVSAAVGQLRLTGEVLEGVGIGLEIVMSVAGFLVGFCLFSEQFLYPLSQLFCIMP